MNNPKVSIVVPCYNVEKYLDRCVRSLINQTLNEIEIILIDDESPDKVPQMCDSWAKQNSRIKVVHKKNAGLGMACNTGIEVASGDYIAFCDSDDWVELYTYERMYSAAIKYHADAVYSGIQKINDKGLVIPMNQADELYVYSSRSAVQAFFLDMIAAKPSDCRERSIQMSAKTVLYKKSTICNNGIRFVSERQFMSEDLLFNLDFIKVSKCLVNLPSTFYYYYDNENSITRKVRTDRIAKYFPLREEMISRYLSFGNQNEIRDRINRMFIGYVRAEIPKIINSTISLNEKKSIIKDVCSNDVWKEINLSYPKKLMPIKHKIPYLLILHKCFWGLFLMSKVR